MIVSISKRVQVVNTDLILRMQLMTCKPRRVIEARTFTMPSVSALLPFPIRTSRITHHSLKISNHFLIFKSS